MPDVWPVSLPQELMRAGNSGGLGDGLIETQPDSGPPTSRPRFSAIAEPLAGAMNMTTAQLAALKTFYKTTLAQGALPFTFPDPLGGDDILVKFPKGSQPTWQEVAPDTYRVAISLLILP